MNSHLWKTILDDLDEDIVNAAAERFGRAKFSGEEPGEYSPDSDPTEYSYSDGKKSRRRFIIGISSTAAAVAAGVFILRGVTMPQEVTQPLAGGTSEVSTVPNTPVDYVESKKESIPEEPVELQTGGFDLELFEEYFYGAWRDDGGWTMQLGYSPNEFFGYSSGRTVAGMFKDSDGCYMLQKTNEGYDMLFVPQYNQDTLYYYYNVTLEDGDVLPSNNEYTGVYTRSGAVVEGNTLGYFGVEKLACEMGVDSDFLLRQDIQFEGGNAELWTRSGAIFPDFDNVFLLEQTDDSVTLCMAYVLTEDPEKQQYFDVTFERDNSGTWEMTTVQSGKLYFGDVELYSGLTKEGLTLFKQHFSDWWYSESDEYPSIVLIYKDDIFTPAEPCSGIAEVTGGWAMRQQSDEGRIYYIPEDETQNMYLYIPDENGFAKRDEYAAVYERSGGAMGYAGSCRISWLGLERYKFMHDDNPDGDSLASVIERALTQDIEIGGSAANYTADMEGWDGYRIAEQSETLVLFSYQLFNAIGESCWVTQELVKQGANWTLGEITERELTNDDIVREEGFVPITWSDDLPLESEVEVDGR